MRRVDISGIAIDVNTGAPLVVLREHDEPHRLLPIFIGAPEATAIAIAATGQHPPRPLVHDLMATMVANLDGRVDTVEVNALQDGTFFASIHLTGPAGSHELDSRPSDALALAVRTGAPVFVSDEVLDEAGSLPEPDEPEGEAVAQLDAAQIDAEVNSFRSFLDDIDPDDFIDVEPTGEADPVDVGPTDAAGQMNPITQPRVSVTDETVTRLDDESDDHGAIDHGPSDDQPAGREPVRGESVDDEPVDDEPVDDAPVGREPVDDEPVVRELDHGAPVDGEPVDDEPVGREPVDGEPVGREPVDGEPDVGESRDDDPRDELPSID